MSASPQQFGSRFCRVAQATLVAAIASLVPAPQTASAVSAGDSLWLAESDALHKLSAADGELLLTLSTGATARAVDVDAGAELSGGLFFNPGLFGQEADLGLFGSIAPTGGFQAGADVFAGFVLGGPCDVQGSTVNVNVSAGPVSLSVFFSPETGKFVGMTLGGGPSFPPIGGSLATSTTGTITVRGN